jgi:SnoaL-like protein
MEYERSPDRQCASERARPPSRLTVIHKHRYGYGVTLTQSGSAARFRAAVEAGDLDAALEQFADDMVFNSPVVFRQYHGKEALRPVLMAVFHLFQNFRYTAEYSGPDGHVLEFAAEVGGRDVQGVDILRGGGADGGDPEAPLTELTVLTRPYSATTALKEQMAALLTG